MKPQDITGKTFNKLKAVKFSKKQGYVHWWLFQCDCGVVKELRKFCVTSGQIMSCGCVRDAKISKLNKTHGIAHSRFNRIWFAMRNRCTKKYDISYKWYGAKGIKVKWGSFLEFKKDMYSSYLQHAKKYGETDTSIDRIDNSKDYSKENCRWATQKVQQNNRTNNKISVIRTSIIQLT